MEKVHLENNEFERFSAQTFRLLHEDSELTDVTLVCEDNRLIPAHKTILGISSKTIRDILLSCQSPRHILNLDVAYEDMVEILSFIYTGSCFVRNQNIARFLQAATYLQVAGLTSKLPKKEPKEEPDYEITDPNDQRTDNVLDSKVNNVRQATKKAQTKIQVKKEPRTYTCIKCGFTTVNKKVLTKHFRNEHRNHGGRPDCYTCEICDFTSYKFSVMKKHRHGMHDVPHYSCAWEGCAYTADTTEEVAMHKKRKHLEKRFHCDLCSFITHEGGYLRVHKRNKHEVNRFNCDLCDKFFNTEGGVVKHRQTIHIGAVFSCQVENCGKSFKGRATLQGHVETDHEGASFTCEVKDCGYTAGRRFTLYAHMKKKHG